MISFGGKSMQNIEPNEAFGNLKSAYSTMYNDFGGAKSFYPVKNSQSSLSHNSNNHV